MGLTRPERGPPDGLAGGGDGEDVGCAWGEGGKCKTAKLCYTTTCSDGLMSTWVDCLSYVKVNEYDGLVNAGVKTYLSCVMLGDVTLV